MVHLKLGVRGVRRIVKVLDGLLESAEAILYVAHKNLLLDLVYSERVGLAPSSTWGALKILHSPDDADHEVTRQAQCEWFIGLFNHLA
jgi:hypothetical protein